MIFCYRLMKILPNREQSWISIASHFSWGSDIEIAVASSVLNSFKAIPRQLLRQALYSNFSYDKVPV
jgi:hypothetical protein